LEERDANFLRKSLRILIKSFRAKRIKSYVVQQHNNRKATRCLIGSLDAAFR